jgi:uncharacterized protein (TIGR03790 family)
MQFPARLFSMLAMTVAAANVWAGGSGVNVIVVVNQNSSNSVQLGNDYCEQRGVPPQNLFRMTGWTGGSITWSLSDFQTRLLNPMLAMLASRGLTNQAEFVLLSMDVPYRVEDSGSQNSTTSALFYGFKYDGAPGPGLPTSCSIPDTSSNSYVFSELPFGDAPPSAVYTNSLLAMMLTDVSLAGAESILSRGVASYASYPTQAVYLAKTDDVARNVRFVEFDDAIFDCRVAGDMSLVYLSTDSTSFTNLLGLLTGLGNYSLPANAFVPGAISDTLTSFAGYILEDSGQTPLLAFLDAGAAASYGTVVEPCNYTNKFPNPLDYFYQARGFSLAEAYYQSLQNPYQGLMVGEPLAAPFARPGSADWSSLADGAVLSGSPTFQPSFSSAASNLPLSRVDLFVDGDFFQTMTNIPPASGNVLSAVVNGFTVNYTVPANATVASAAAGLAAALNAHANSTHVQAYPMGDRIQLQSLRESVPGGSVTLSTGTASGSAPQLTTLLTAARPTFLDTSATGYVQILVGNAPQVGDWLQFRFTKTNGVQVTVAVTNTTSGATIGALAQSLVNLINATASLQSSDGLSASDFIDYDPEGLTEAMFTLYARSPGWPAAQIQEALTVSADLESSPPGTSLLEQNLSDLEPRNHLYVSSGVTSLPIDFVLDTTQLPDGYHQLSAIAYEGTSVRTQTGVSRNVRVQNTSLTASLAALPAGTNATLDMQPQFTVSANLPNISRIELFTTGGSAGVVSNQQVAVLSLSSASLGLGLHPFYALVTDTAGDRYQTQTDWIRIIPSITVAITGPPLTLSWQTMPGRQYDILSTTNLSAAFQTVASVTASNTVVQWPISAANGIARFYRVKLDE